MRPRGVVIIREFRQQVIEMLFSKDDELRQTFELDRLDDQFAATVQIR